MLLITAYSRAYGINEFLKRLVRARTVGYLFLDRSRPVNESIHHHAVQVTDSGECVTVRLKLPKQFTTQTIASFRQRSQFEQTTCFVV